MLNKYRLTTGGAIDRKVPIKFTFNGKIIEGYLGDTVASALLSNGINTTGRSFKYHRPRGIISVGLEEAGTFIEVMGKKGASSFPATMVPIEEGLRVKSINCWPNPSVDFGQVMQLISPLIPSGFYYKTFFQPQWKTFEPFIRKMAGLADIPESENSTTTYDSRDTHCEFLVIGGGVAGLVAALMTARTGKRVVFVDNHMETFGNWSLPLNESSSIKQWVQTLMDELNGYSNVRILTKTMAWGYREQNLVLAYETRDVGKRELAWRIRSRNVILSMGCTERGLVFPHNDRPGIMLASGLLNYCRNYAVIPGDRIILYTNNNSIKVLAKALLEKGKEIVAIIDTHEEGLSDYTDLPKDIAVYSGHEINMTTGWNRFRTVIASPIMGGKSITLHGDLLAVSGGWNPNLQLWIQSGGLFSYADELATFVPTNSEQNVIAVGSLAGKFDFTGEITDTVQKISDLITTSGLDIKPFQIPEIDKLQDKYSIRPYWESENADVGSKSFVDLMNDVTLADIKLALREGYDDIELVKRYTTLGMGLDQGKTGNVNASGIISNATGKTLDEVGLIKYRSPVSPVSFGVLGKPEGEIVKPYKTTPITKWNRENGAVLYEAGANWKRPGYYLLRDESMMDAINREAIAARTGLAIYDGSPLATFEVKGKDAARFLELIFTIPIHDIPVGMGRYGLMLTEEGFILDDGVCFNMAENWYQLSLSTGNVDLVHQHLEKHLQYDFTHLDVTLTNLTLQWMNATVCGSKARTFLQQFTTDIDLTPEAFPFMGIRDGEFNGIPARIARVSFTGELSFEINVRPRDLEQLWEILVQRGDNYGITPIGSETNHVLRVEKGFISLGHEVDGKIDPIDLGLGWVIGKGKKDFIGKRAIELNRTSKLPRKELVGLVSRDPHIQFAEGSPLVASEDNLFVEGHVTASVWSEINQRYVALALLDDGRTRMGDKVNVRNLDGIEAAEVTKPCYYDREGTKLRS